ncbi:phosphoribosylanthranilate isomerase [Bacillus sp. Bva_UNVM-123]|uniref:phosphoribosylanthranilate isomerase n=1 Tax=Bacillus sp. Bva_UNVM-123 TaxID=2829798 RepID=UPI00391FBC3B
MKVKVCGMTDLHTVLTAIQYGADAIGFVFAESKRRITVKKAKEIIQQLPAGILKVGVFVNEEKEQIEKIIEQSGINVVQLHGDETPQFCSYFTVPVIKAISIETEKDIAEIEEYKCDYILLDSPKGKYRGGNGIVFNWDLLKKCQLRGRNIILAGGLTSENVVSGIKLVNPYMVDVSSGVETDGKKDPEKINNFIKAVKEYKREDIKC